MSIFSVHQCQWGRILLFVERTTSIRLSPWPNALEGFVQGTGRVFAGSIGSTCRGMAAHRLHGRFLYLASEDRVCQGTRRKCNDNESHFCCYSQSRTRNLLHLTVRENNILEGSRSRSTLWRRPPVVEITERQIRANISAKIQLSSLSHSR